MFSPQVSVPADCAGGIVTIGNFDGVHRGHQVMLHCARQIADEQRIPVVAVTFDPHPGTVLNENLRLPRLTSIGVRCRLLRQFGADHVVVLPVDRQLLQMSARQFFAEVVVQQFRAAGLVEGPNFCFGRDRQGDIRVLKQLCREHGIQLRVVEPVLFDGSMISSSVIRRYLAEGNFDHAVELLGHPYTIDGVVVPGDARGRDLGFPTANLQPVDQQLLLPTDGVYVGTVLIGGQTYGAAVSIGGNPTFDSDRRKVECFVIGFSGDLYGRVLELDLHRRLRDLQTFSDSKTLVRAIDADVTAVKTWLRKQQDQ